MKKMGVLDRVEIGKVLPSNFPSEGMDLGGPYDMILVAPNYFTQMGWEKATEFMEILSLGLKSTGRIVLQENLKEPDGSAAPYLQSLAMFAAGKPGKVRSLSWFRELFVDCGFATPTLHNLSPFPDKLLISYKNIISRIAKNPKEIKDAM